MADIVITATSVVAGSDAVTSVGSAGEAITAGQALYVSSTTGKLMRADSNSATLEARQATCIALNGGALNQPIVTQSFGDIAIGATLVAGSAYYLSDTPGGICPVADVGTGESVCMIGIAKSTSVLSLGFRFPNVVL